MGTLVNGIKEIFATSQSTATHLPVCASDGTPQGRISVGDLASVLGGLPYKFLPAEGDANNIVVNGFYVCNGNAQNLPSQATYYLTAYCNYDNSCLQYAQRPSDGRVFVRSYYSGSWISWRELSTDIPIFYKNYSDFNSLSLALFGKKYISGSASGIVKTDIQVNQSHYGGCAIVLASDHTDSGDRTSSGVYMIRFGYSGNNVSATEIVKSSGAGVQISLTVGYSDDSYLTLSGYRAYIIIFNK